MIELFFIVFVVCCIRGFNIGSVIIGAIIKVVLTALIRAFLGD